MTGQLSSVQKSVMVPYNMLIWLKKSTAKKKAKKEHIKNKLSRDQIPTVPAQIVGIEFPHSHLPAPLYCPVQTLDQGTLQFSATNYAIAHCQGHIANFGLPSVEEIGSVCVGVPFVNLIKTLIT